MVLDLRSIGRAVKGDGDGYAERDLRGEVDEDFHPHGFCACAQHWEQFFKHCNLHLTVEMIVFIVVLIDGCVLSIEMYDVYHDLPFEVALPQVALAVVAVLAALVMVEIYFNVEHGYNMVGVLLTIELVLLFGSIFFVANELVYVENFEAFCATGLKDSERGRRLAAACAKGTPGYKTLKEMSNAPDAVSRRSLVAADDVAHRSLAGGVPGVYGFLKGFNPKTGELLIVIIGALRLTLVAYNLIYTFVLLSTLEPLHKQDHGHGHDDHEHEEIAQEEH